MKCVVCKQAETRPGVTTVTLGRGDSTFVVRDVPAQVCPNCGEDYVDSKVTAELLRSAENLSRLAPRLILGATPQLSPITCTSPRFSRRMKRESFNPSHCLGVNLKT
jgi:YgiT-type zinc finger domain-containing protein